MEKKVANPASPQKGLQEFDDVSPEINYVFIIILQIQYN
jgi:hypothetical protein